MVLSKRLMSHEAVGSRMIDIRHVGEAAQDRPKILASQWLDLRGTQVVVDVASVVLPATEGLRPTGDRTAVATFATVHAVCEQLQLVRGPLLFAAHKSRGRDCEVRREWRTLNALGNGVTPGAVHFVPDAPQTPARVYESTAPGVPLQDCIEWIADAYQGSGLSERHTALLLARIYHSARSGLHTLHQAGIEHRHPHERNFNVDLQTGHATLFDYTESVVRHRVAGWYHRSAWRDAAQRDTEYFDGIWQRRLETHGLSAVKTPAEDNYGDMQQAVGRLETVATRAILAKLGLTALPDADIQQVIAAQDWLIGRVPDIYYPHSTDTDRRRPRLRRLARQVLDAVVYTR
jgi:hypothetical protein